MTWPLAGQADIGQVSLMQREKGEENGQSQESQGGLQTGHGESEVTSHGHVAKYT